MTYQSQRLDGVQRTRTSSDNDHPILAARLGRQRRNFGGFAHILLEGLFLPGGDVDLAFLDLGLEGVDVVDRGSVFDVSGADVEAGCAQVKSRRCVKTCFQ